MSLDAEQVGDRARHLAERAGFGDLFVNGFEVSSYDNEEIRQMGEDPGNWVGQYVAGSMEGGPVGLNVLVYVDRHRSEEELLGTVLHEIGHALWDLLDAESQARWEAEAAGDPYGPRESFADDFMWYCLGERSTMRHRVLFDEVTRVGA